MIASLMGSEECRAHITAFEYAARESWCNADAAQRLGAASSALSWRSRARLYDELVIKYRELLQGEGAHNGSGKSADFRNPANPEVFNGEDDKPSQVRLHEPA